jgi:hypothetical protein
MTGQKIGDKMFWQGEFCGHSIYIVPKDVRVSFSALTVPEGVSIRLPDSNRRDHRKGKACFGRRKSHPRPSGRLS